MPRGFPGLDDEQLPQCAAGEVQYNPEQDGSWNLRSFPMSWRWLNASRIDAPGRPNRQVRSRNNVPPARYGREAYLARYTRYSPKKTRTSECDHDRRAVYRETSIRSEGGARRVQETQGRYDPALNDPGEACREWLHEPRPADNLAIGFFARSRAMLDHLRLGHVRLDACEGTSDPEPDECQTSAAVPATSRIWTRQHPTPSGRAYAAISL